MGREGVPPAEHKFHHTADVLAITLQQIRCPRCSSRYYLVYCSEHRNVYTTLIAREALHATAQHFEDHLLPDAPPPGKQEGAKDPAR